MKLIVETSKTKLDNYKKIGAKAFIFGLKEFSSGYEDQLRKPFCFAQKQLINRVLINLTKLMNEDKVQLFEQNVKKAIELANTLQIHA